MDRVTRPSRRPSTSAPSVRRFGFGLFELLVVVAVTVALILPAERAVRRASLLVNLFPDSRGYGVAAIDFAGGLGGPWSVAADGMLEMLLADG